jgi:hypothetical protein
MCYYVSAFIYMGGVSIYIFLFQLLSSGHLGGGQGISLRSSALFPFYFSRLLRIASV